MTLPSKIAADPQTGESLIRKLPLAAAIPMGTPAAASEPAPVRSTVAASRIRRNVE